MKRLPALFLLASLAGAAGGGAAHAAGRLACQGFIEGLQKASGEHRMTFARSLNIGRAGGYDYWDATGEGDVDASVQCRGDAFARFELRAAVPPSARARARYDRLAQAALAVALGLDRGRAQQAIAGLTRETDEFLRASRERGDVYVAGKAERHFGSRGDLGMFSTDTDRTLIVTNE